MRPAKTTVTRFVPLPSLALALRRTFRRQAGGDVFRALDFVLVPVAGENIFLDRAVAQGVSAGFMRGAIRALRRVGVQSAGRTETLATTAATGEVAILWFTHSFCLIGPTMDVNVLQ